MSLSSSPSTADLRCDLAALALPGVAGLTPYQPGKPVEELERELGISGIVKLASNENPLGPGPRARAAVAAGIGELGRYPDGGGYVLKQALAGRLGIAAEQITLGNGSNEILELVARTFVSPAHDVVFAQHAFAVYPLVTQAVGARAVEVPAQRWGHDLQAMARAVGGDTRLVFIANPNNPTGTWLSRPALEAFLERMPATVIVVVDEAYFEYVEAPDYPNALEWVSRYPNLLVTRTFSKIHGLAGLRIGYGVASAALTELLNRVRQPFNVNSLAQLGALAALEDSDHLEASRELNRNGLAQLETGLRRLGLEFIPSVANFITVHMGRSAGPIYQALLRRGVIVRPVANYGLPQHLRITVGLEAENARLLQALGEVLRGE